MTAYDRLMIRFNGHRPRVSCWSPTEYRVVYDDWHLHNGAAYGSPCADGKTLEAACDALLRQVDAAHAELVEGRHCDQPCANRYNASDKSKLAHQRLWEHITRTAAQVDRWPAWKRGLPPCASEGCNMATGHPGECE